MCLDSFIHFKPADFSIKLHVHQIKAGLSIVYIEKSQVIHVISKINTLRKIFKGTPENFP